MERVMTVEEKIRRAEEIYQRRKQGEIRPITKVTVNDKKDIKLLKKMIIQVLICIVIYLIFYMIQNNQYIFSEDFIQKSNEILSYDTNFMELYEMVKNQVMNLIHQESEENETNNEAIGGAEQEVQEIQEQPIVENTDSSNSTNENQENTENLSQEEIDIQNIKNTSSFIKPIEGIITSGYGQRDSSNENIPKNHTGTDIAADLGTKIVSATDGEVVLASEEGDYRKALKNSNWRSKYYLCTLQ